MATLSGSKNRRRKVQSFLESSFQACTRNCIEVDVESLKKFLASNHKAYDILSEALEIKEFALNFKELADNDAVHADWKCWFCLYCQLGFANSRTHANHMWNVHFNSLPDDVNDFLRDFMDGFPQEWSEKLANSCWIPIDITSWVVSGDAERKKLLESVGKLFQTLMQLGTLHISHLDTMLDYAMGVVQGRMLPEVLKMNGVDRSSTLCFRCLDVAQLNHVQGFLNKLLEKCKAGPSMEEESASDDNDAFLDSPYNSMRVLLDHRRSTIVIYADKWFRLSDNTNGTVSYNVDAAAVVSWLYDDPLTVENALKSWEQLQQARNDQRFKLYEKVRARFEEIKALHSVDRRWMRYKDALEKLEVMRSFEGRDVESMVWSFGEIMEGWKEHLSEEDIENFTSAHTDILREAIAIADSGYGEDDLIMKAFVNAKENMNMEFHLNAARVQNCITAISQIRERDAVVSSFDCLNIVIPILKRFLLEKWESESKSPKGDKKPR